MVAGIHHWQTEEGARWQCRVEEEWTLTMPLWKMIVKGALFIEVYHFHFIVR